MPDLHRRDFIKLGAGLLGAALLPTPAFAVRHVPLESRRTLSFFNTHTGERLVVCFFDQVYRPEGLKQIDHILRDFRCGSVKAIDLDLLNQLYALKCRLKPRTPFHVISGYRSPKTNEKLRRLTSGVAKFSLHTQGRAIDIRLPGCRTDHLAKTCIAMKSGGVGYYPKSDFVHIDTGRVRTW